MFKKSINFVMVIGAVLGAFLLYQQIFMKEIAVKPGIVIVLNGPSAAGKSSLQKAIQRLAPVPYLNVGIDNFFNDLFPDEHGKLGCKADADFGNDLRWVTIAENLVYLHVGSAGQKIVKGMNKAIAAYAKTGNNVVVDYIMYEQSWLQNLLHELQGCPVYLVGVTVSLDILQAREQARSTSPIGHAGSHYHTVHVGNKYDLWIDNSQGSADEGAMKILEFVENNPR
ncbi:AAA family ATPase [Candidatus Babeliales bacterium]|nr:AAA family ATPase [Candidatus Babeliales bacterium]MBP9844361.1 AAA family ATPase [Candidatus Babeliales bacterium]